MGKRTIKIEQRSGYLAVQVTDGKGGSWNVGTAKTMKQAQQIKKAARKHLQAVGYFKKRR